MKVLVTGANGYVGTHLCNHLIQQGDTVWALVRPGCSPKEQKLLTGLGARVVACDLIPEQPLPLAPGQVEVAIHLLGSLDAPARGNFRSVHQGKTRRLIEECRRLRIPKVVYLGTLGAGPEAVSEYLRTKWLAQDDVEKSGLDYVVLRAPLIFGKILGERDSKVLRRLKEQILQRPRIPVLGSGKNLLQPIFIGDLLRCIEKAARDASLRNEVIDVGGPEPISFEHLLDSLARELNVRKQKIKIPLPLAFFVAALLERFDKRPLITRDQVRMMRVDVTCSLDRMKHLLVAPRVRFGS